MTWCVMLQCFTVLHVFPRVDLLSVTGGRDMIEEVAYRDRLPNPDDDPMQLFQTLYGLTLAELTALIGGAHNFGSAHGKCTGYVGQWTATPLSWFGPNGSDPSFFPDLMREDWRWYEVCTFENKTSVYTSMEDPFESGAIFEGEEEEEDEPVNQCSLQLNVKPLICEEQAMRGCDFEDGPYDASESPCDINLLQFRLKSDFFLKKNQALMPFAEEFAEDPNSLAEQFGIAYHKLTHRGIDRCGLSGHGCPEGTVCQQLGDHPMTKTCVSAEASTLDSQYNVESSSSSDVETTLLYVVTAICSLTLLVAALTAFKMFQGNGTAPPAVVAKGEADLTSQESEGKPSKRHVHSTEMFYADHDI
ncbi:MAG: hypothetical protein SGILL_006670 [Bacillariaceae sp.]